MDSVPVARNGRKLLMPKSTSRKGIRVVGKIRPYKESEEHCSGSQVSVSREGGDYASLILHDQANGYRDTYILDGCYEQEESAKKLFVHEVKPLLRGILNGDNSCVIAYGAKGSGKTQLIQGSVEIPGLAMMAVCEIFSVIEEAGGSMAISCYEIYHDHIYDLLGHKEQEVQVLEDAEKKIQLRGLSKVPIESLSDFEKYYFPISNQRKLPQKATKEFRIRSHKGLITYVTCVDKEPKNSLVGKINFIDLEGYEDVRKQTDAKAYLSDCTKINKSLHALLNVVSALNGDETYIPYREAKLTRLLQDFLCMKNAVLVTCLSPRLFPDTIRAISLASRSCQFVNRLKHDTARTSKECRGPFPSLSSIYGIHPSDKTVMKRGPTNELGSSRKKINGIPSKSNRRFQAPGSAIKKPAASPFWSKGKKLFNVASPLVKSERLANTWSEEECVGSNSFAASSALREENVVSSAISVSCPLEEDNLAHLRATESSVTKEDASVPDSHVHQSFDISLETELELYLDPEGFALKSGQRNSCDDGGKHSPTLTEQLRDISNTLKTLSSQPISICTSKADEPCNSQLSIECVEPKTPGFPSCTKLDYYSIPESFTTPQEKFKTRSAGLKKSLVNECLDFLNSARKEELKQLKGIGEKRANYILELREETPKPFKEIGDLKGLGLSSKQIKGMMSRILADI